MTENLQKTIDFLYSIFDASAYYSMHPQEKPSRLAHTIRVANLAGEIAEKEGLDIESAVIGGLLHDLSYCNMAAGDAWFASHGPASACIAKPFLEAIGLSAHKIQDICAGISQHETVNLPAQEDASLLAKAIWEANRIDSLFVQFQQEAAMALENPSWPAAVLARLEAEESRVYAFPAARSLAFLEIRRQQACCQALKNPCGKSDTLLGEKFTPQKSQIMPPIIRSR